MKSEETTFGIPKRVEEWMEIINLMNGSLHVPLIIKSYSHVHLHYLHNE